MPLYGGASRLSKLYCGTTPILRAYLGAEKVFEQSSGGEEPWEEILAAATAAGAVAVYDPDNPNTWTLREDSGNFFYTEIADALGNYPDLVQTTDEAWQPDQVTLSTGRKVMGREGGAERNMATAAFAAAIGQPDTIVAVARFGATGVGAQNIFTSSGIVANVQTLRTSSSNHQMTAGTSLSAASAGTNWKVWHANFDGASSELIIDGSLGASGNAGTNGLGAAGVMSRISSGGVPADGMEDGGRIGPVILFDAVKSAVDLAALYTAINAHYPIGSAA
jgi:hypothetical protein